MDIKMLKRTLGLCVVLGIFISTSIAQANESLVIYAAASLTDVFEQLAEQYQQTHPNVTIQLSFGGSSLLATQIEMGAPADVFASANLEQMQRLVDGELITEDSVEVFATNQLVLIVPLDNPANIQTPQDLTRDGVQLLLTTPDVPIRRYTDELLTLLANEYGDTYQQDVLENVVSEEENVRQLLTKIALGEADATFVYASDLFSDLGEQVQVIPLPMLEQDLPSILYPITPLTEAQNPQQAQAFIEFVLSETGQSTLREFGFCAVPESEMTLESTPEATSEATPEISITQCP
jgi:molybdate transport system substrate-binding protein